MNSLASSPAEGTRRPRLFRAAPDFTAESIQRAKLVSFVLGVVPAEQRPALLSPVENLPRLYAMFRTQEKIGPDEVALVGNQMRIEAGLVRPPSLGAAEASLTSLLDSVCEALEAGRMRFSVALQTVRVAATVFRIFQVWRMRPLKEPVPVQLEPMFVRKWMTYPNEGPRLCEELKVRFLRPRLSTGFRQQRKRAHQQLADCSYPELSASQIIRALQWLRALEFIEVAQYYLRVKGWHAIPRYQLCACPIQDVFELAYPTHYDDKRKAAKKKRAKAARIKLRRAEA